MKSKQIALLNPQIDFWLIGGVSLLARLLVIFIPTVNLDEAQLNIASNIALFLFSYPHLLLTYRLAARSRNQNRFTFFGIPALMLAAVTLSLLPNGKALFWAELLTTATFILAAFHHSKQAFGCFTVYSERANYTLSPRQKSYLLWLFNALWMVSVLATQNRVDKKEGWAGLELLSIGLPAVFAQIGAVLLFGFILWLCFKIAYVNWRTTEQWPPLLAWITVPALAVWWIPPFFDPRFYIFVAFAFHPLQYIPFSARAEGKTEWRSWLALMLGAIFVSGLAFAGVPALADRAFQVRIGGEAAFFIAAATLVLNVHHFFLDRVMWRSSRQEFRKMFLNRAD